MQLAMLSALLLFIATSYGQDTSLSSDIVANVWSTAAFIDIPRACNYSNLAATLVIKSSVNVSGTGNFAFTVPQCRLKRDLVVISSSASGNVDTVNVGYQVTNLTPGATYSANYVIGNVTFNPVSFTTLTLATPSDVFARSGGMVVITVLLSVAMFLLIVGLIVVLALGARGK